MTEPIKLVLTVPGKDSPGFLRRLHKAASFQERIKTEGISPALVVGIVDFVSDYIEGEKESVKDMLWDCSENQFNEFMSAISGGGAEVIPPQ
jgi:hypothetical protein